MGKKLSDGVNLKKETKYEIAVVDMSLLNKKSPLIISGLFDCKDCLCVQGGGDPFNTSFLVLNFYFCCYEAIIIAPTRMNFHNHADLQV